MCPSSGKRVKRRRITSAVSPVTRRWRRGVCADGVAGAGCRHHSGWATGVLEKPSDLLDAKDMLESLSGKVHQVMTAVALASKESLCVRLVTTNVAFRKLDEAEIEAYWQTGEPCDKAGLMAFRVLPASLSAASKGAIAPWSACPAGDRLADQASSGTAQIISRQLCSAAFLPCARCTGLAL